MGTQAAPARSPGRKRLTRDDVVRAAGAVAARGVEDLTMAAVAAELGVTAMALYQHVSDKTHLLSLLMDSVLAQIEVPSPSAGPWDVRLRRLHRDVSAAMTQYRGLVSYALALTELPRLLDGYLQILLDAGFDARTAGAAYTGLYYLAMGAQQPIPGDLPSPAAAPSAEGRRATALVASALSNVTSEELQLAALDVYLDGLRLATRMTFMR